MNCESLIVTLPKFLLVFSLLKPFCMFSINCRIIHRKTFPNQQPKNCQTQTLNGAHGIFKPTNLPYNKYHSWIGKKKTVIRPMDPCLVFRGCTSTMMAYMPYCPSSFRTFGDFEDGTVSWCKKKHDGKKWDMFFCQIDGPFFVLK